MCACFDFLGQKTEGGGGGGGMGSPSPPPATSLRVMPSYVSRGGNKCMFSMRMPTLICIKGDGKPLLHPRYQSPFDDVNLMVTNL